MTRKSQHRRHSKSYQVEPQQPSTSVQRPLASGHELLENENFRAKRIEELIAPSYSFPFDGQYNTELELDIPNGTPLLGRNLKTQSQGQQTYVPVARPWDQQHADQAHRLDGCSHLGQGMFVVWENQGSAKEPFNCVGEVILVSGCCVTEELPQRGAQ